MISWRARQVLFLLMIAFVVFVHGIASPIWPWNVAPIFFKSKWGGSRS